MNASDECFLFLEEGGQRWPCEAGGIIGRAGTVALDVLRHVETLSRRHLQVDKRGPTWYVTVLPEVRNTTWMEGQSMQRGVAYPLLGVRAFQVDQFHFYLATANGMMTQTWTRPPELQSHPGYAHSPTSGPLFTPAPSTQPVADFRPGSTAPEIMVHGHSVDGLPGAVVELDIRLHMRAANAGAVALLGKSWAGRDFDEWASERIRVRDFLLRLAPGEKAGPITVPFTLPGGARELELHAAKSTDIILVQLRDASADRERERGLADTAQQLARQTQTLAELSLSPAFQEGDLAHSLSLLTVRGADVLRCRRVGVWLRDDDPAGGQKVTCQAVHDRTGAAPTGAVTGLGYCPLFFDQVAAKAWAATHDRTPVMALLREIGFAQKSTSSLLAAALQQGGKTYGLLSFERDLELGTGDRATDWSEADRNFALCLASLGTAALQSRERQEAFGRLHESEKHMAAELAEAESYVRRTLPEPVLSGPVTTEWVMEPSEKVGGDSFGYHWADDDLMVLYVLDVVGHGTGAALLSVSVMNHVRAKLPGGEASLGDPARVLAELNEAFQMEEQNGLTFTMWFGVYDRRSRILSYASGGHPSALLLLPDVEAGRADYDVLGTEGPVIGGLPGVEFTTARTPIARGSKLFLCTDGAFEIPLGGDREWSFEEFIATVRSTRYMDSGETAYLKKRVAALCAAPRFPDDFCVVRFAFDQ